MLPCRATALPSRYTNSCVTCGSTVLATAQRFPLWVGFATYYRGWVLAMQGQGKTGLAQMRQGMATVMATGAELSRPLCLVLLA